MSLASLLIRVLATSSTELAWKPANPASMSVSKYARYVPTPRAAFCRIVPPAGRREDRARQTTNRPSAVGVVETRSCANREPQRCDNVKECSLRVGSIACQPHDDRPQRRRDVQEICWPCQPTEKTALTSARSKLPLRPRHNLRLEETGLQLPHRHCRHRYRAAWPFGTEDTGPTGCATT